MDKINKSFIYLFPVIYKGIVQELQCPYDYLKPYLLDIINTYCFLNNHKRFVIELNPSEKVEKLLSDLELLTNFDRIIRTDSSIVVVLKVNPDSRDCFIKYATGKYSKIGESNKNAIIKFLLTFLKGSPIGDELIIYVYKVLKKDEGLRKRLEKEFEMSLPDDLELSSIIDIKQETYEYKD